MKLSKTKTGFPWWVHLTVLAVAFGIIGFGIWALFSPAVPEEKLLQLRAGMTGDEIREILGQPIQIKENRKANGGFMWLYGSSLKRSSLRIDLSKDERFVGFSRRGESGGAIIGSCYWGVQQVCEEVGATAKAREMQFKGMCASMGWEGLRFRCESDADAQRLEEVMRNFFDEQGHLIPNYNAWTYPTGDPAVRCIVVTNSSSALESDLRDHGFSVE